MLRIKFLVIGTFTVLGVHRATLPTYGSEAVVAADTRSERVVPTKEVGKRQATASVRVLAELIPMFLIQILFDYTLLNAKIWVEGRRIHWFALSWNIGLRMLLSVLIETTGVMKAILGIEVVDAEGKPLARDKMFYRALLKYALNLFSALGLLMDEGTLWHNKLTHSYVVDKEVHTRETSHEGFRVNKTA